MHYALLSCNVYNNWENVRKGLSYGLQLIVLEDAKIAQGFQPMLWQLSHARTNVFSKRQKSCMK